MHVKSIFFYFLPFLFYMIGYLIPSHLLQRKIIITPNIIGQSLTQGLLECSQHAITAHVIKEVEDSILPTGTIVDQTPSAGRHIKEGQTIYLIISKQPALFIAPHVEHMSLQSIMNKINQNEYTLETHYIPSEQPIDHCIAQSPSAGNSLMPHQPLIIYLSAGLQKPIIWPNFVGLSLEQVCMFLQEHEIIPHILPSNAPDNATIVEQRPLAGTLIGRENLSSLAVQLLVS